MKNLLLSSLSFFFIGCSIASEPAQNIAALHDIYVTTYIDNYNLNAINNASAKPTLEIFVADKRFSGNTGCNYIHGTLKISNDSIDFTSTPMMTTLMICEWDSLEQAYISALEKVESYSLQEGELWLYNNNQVILKLKKVD